MANICLIEDERSLSEILKVYLERDAHHVTCFYTLEDFCQSVPSYDEYDIYLIDIMLPDGSGTEILKYIKDKAPLKPVILMSGRNECIDRVLGFEMGCDDYLPKPFLPMELCYRVNNILKRYSAPNNDDIIKFNCYILDKSERRIRQVNNEPVDVTSKEFDIILYLLNHAGAAISRDQLLKNIWGNDYYGYYRVVDNHIKNIRKKLPELHLETIYGYGYRCIL